MPVWFIGLMVSLFVTGCNADASFPVPDLGAPSSVISTVPGDSAVGVAINSKITATFDGLMDPSSNNTATFTIAAPGAVMVTGVVTYDVWSQTTTFSPAANLPGDTLFTATITTGTMNLAGVALENDKIWTFTTNALADVISPSVNSVEPLDTAVGVQLNKKVVANFSEAVDPATVNGTTFTLTGPSTPVDGTVSYVNRTAKFTPTANLSPLTLYTATITTGVTDLATIPNALASDVVWEFTTGSILSAGPEPVILGTAGDYVILAKTGVSTTGTTAIVGDIGISPAKASALTGFTLSAPPTTFATSPLVTGALWAADYDDPTPTNLTAAVLDMEGAYTDAAGRTLPDYTELGSGDISGMTLTPGLYKWGTGVLITSGVTLEGGANDVWIFQIAGTLTVGDGAIVTLTGALPKNVFWQVAGQATLGTTSDFKGVILGQTAIVLQTGATLNGRALAQTAVTLDANDVTEPTP